MNRYTPTPSATTPTPTPADWDAIAARTSQPSATAGLPHRRMEGLALGYDLPAVAASIGVTPNAAADRFKALRIGMMDIHQRFTLDAQLALVRALRGRLN